MHTKSREVRWFPVHFPVGVMFSGFFRRVLHGTRDLDFHVLQAVQQQRIEGPAHPGTDHLHHFAVGTGVAVHRAAHQPLVHVRQAHHLCFDGDLLPLQAVCSKSSQISILPMSCRAAAVAMVRRISRVSG